MKGLNLRVEKKGESILQDDIYNHDDNKKERNIDMKDIDSSFLQDDIYNHDDGPEEAHEGIPYIYSCLYIYIYIDIYIYIYKYVYVCKVLRILMKVFHIRHVLFAMKFMHKCFSVHYLCLRLSLCVLRMRYRQDCEILTHDKILSKHHHYHDHRYHHH
jgi:hypothetical protein